MGKDIFGNPRYHCTHPGCNCDDFRSRAQKDIEDNEAESGNMEELESKYHMLTCQAKSEYQLFCSECDHNVSSHSQKPRKQKQDRFEGEAGVRYVLHGVLFRKEGADPERARLLKLRRAVGAEARITHRRWRGPSGGVWAELDVRHDEPVGWVLLEGPGVGIEGPILSWSAPVSEHDVAAQPEVSGQRTSCEDLRPPTESETRQLAAIGMRGCDSRSRM